MQNQLIGWVVVRLGSQEAGHGGWQPFVDTRLRLQLCQRNYSATPAQRLCRPAHPMRSPEAESVTPIGLFVCGDVMTGRGVDQVLPYPGNPVLYEPYIRDAREYVRLAERVNGPITQPVDFAYMWGDALGELERFGPDVRLINLETSITSSEDAWPGKEG